jgi:DNA-binding MarR family transcriptional regulator
MSVDDALRQSFGYWVSRLARGMREAVDRDFARHGVNVAHWAILAACETEDGMRIVDLSRSIGVDAAGLTRLVDKLDQAGLVIRAADPVDKRAQRILLTDKGRALLPELKAISARHNAWWLEALGMEAADMVPRLRSAVDRAEREL